MPRNKSRPNPREVSTSKATLGISRIELLRRHSFVPDRAGRRPTQTGRKRPAKLLKMRTPANEKSSRGRCQGNGQTAEIQCAMPSQVSQYKNSMSKIRFPSVSPDGRSGGSFHLRQDVHGPLQSRFNRCDTAGSKSWSHSDYSDRTGFAVGGHTPRYLVPHCLTPHRQNLPIFARRFAVTGQARIARSTTS